MSSLAQKQRPETDDDEEEQLWQQQVAMLDGVTELNQSLSDSISNALGVKSIGDYISDGFDKLTGKAPGSDNNNTNSADSFQTTGNNSQDDTSGVDKLNKSINDSVNNALGVDSIENYASKAFGMMSGDTTSSVQEATFSTSDSQSVLDSQDKSSNNVNQTSEFVDLVEDNPEVIAAL